MESEMSELTPEAVKAALDEATPGPWRWEISFASKRVELSGDGGDLTVMDFVRWGMSGAAARFWRWGGKPRTGQPQRADEVAIPEPGREHHASWHRIIDDPNARLIAMAPDLATAYLALTAERDALAKKLAQAEALLAAIRKGGGEP
jgi:hypothetical protein